MLNDEPARWPVYVLAGGQSSRFGADKALAPLDGKPLILHVLEAFAPIAGPACAVVDRPDRLAPLPLPFVPLPFGYTGPTCVLVLFVGVVAIDSSSASVAEVSRKIEFWAGLT